MRAWLRIVDRLRGEPRALGGLMLIAALAALAGLLDWDERRMTRQVEVNALRVQVARWKATAAEKQWPATSEESRVLLAEFRGRTWREESEGRIQARLQDWLRETLATHQIKLLELNVAQPQVDEAVLPKDMRIVRARMTMEFASDAMTSLLADLSAQERWVWLERLTVKNHPNQRVVEIDLAALYVIGVREVE